MAGTTRRRLLGATPAALALSSGAGLSAPQEEGDAVILFLSGDVMLGRGIDQILPHPVDPVLYEPYVQSARTYVELAEEAHGAIPRRVDFAYVWGDVLETLRQVEPAARIINLETAITDAGDPAAKGIHYRLNPANIEVLEVAGIDCCGLANNHVLDWGPAGLLETLETLDEAGIAVAGAGRTAAAAAAPAVLPIGPGRRVLVFAFGTRSSGIPRSWAAAGAGPGVFLLSDLSTRTVERIATLAQAARQSGDLLVASIHWGGNWGFQIPAEQRRFAHGLIERAGFDVVHGHSSHHAKGIEVYQGRPILYGAGDFLNDYEGISGHDEYRDDLAVMYLPHLDVPGGDLIRFPLHVFQIRNFRLQPASAADTAELQAILERESRPFGTRIRHVAGNRLAVLW